MEEVVSTTRFGFEGGEPEGPPVAEGPRVAKTVFGRDFHLPAVFPSVQGAASLPPPSGRTGGASRPAITPPPSRVATPRARALTPRPSRKSGEFATPRSAIRKSSPPAKARFLGRRNTAGNFVPLTQTDLLTLPRPAWMRPAFTVFAAAASSFLVVAAVLWGLNRSTPTQAPTPQQSQRRTEAVANAEAKVIVPPPAPSPAPPPASDAPPQEARPHPSVKTGAAFAPASRPKLGKAAAQNRTRRPERPTDPDAPLPPTFF